MFKKVFVFLGLIVGMQHGYAQYEIRHNLTFGANSTNIIAKKFDQSSLAVNIDSVYTLSNGKDTTVLRANPQDTYLDYNTTMTANWFVGYKLTLDFNQRYSFDVGVVLNKRGFRTEMNRDVHHKDLTFDQLYEANKYYPLSGKLYRFHEDYSEYRLELPLYGKVNMNSFLSIYGGFNFSFQIQSSDKTKALGTHSIVKRADGGFNVILYNMNTDFDIDGVLGIDALFGRKFSVFIQGEYGLQSIDVYRSTGIRFVGVKMGFNYVFKRL